MRRIGSFIFAAIGLISPAVAQDAVAPAAPQAAAAQDASLPASPPAGGATETQIVIGTPPPNPADKIVCMLGDPPTGSRLGARQVCHTAGEWSDIRANGTLLLDDMQRRRDNAMQMQNGRR
jgi:hypothetical protein